MDNYEQKYNEALERARTIMDGKDGWNYCDHIEIDPVIKEIFPELRESEDEKIRKDMIAFLKSEKAFQTIDLPISERWIAWLEKQKERQDNPNAHEGSWSGFNTISSQGKDTNIETIAQQYVENTKVCNDTPTWDLIHTAVIFGYQQSEKQKEQKDCSACSQHLDGYVSGRCDAKNKLLEQFGAITTPEDELKVKSRWKPSEEQMEALNYALQVMNTDLSPIAARTYQGLQEIQQNLKKLM